MQTKAIPTSAPGDCAPTSEEPAPIKMTNQQLDTPKATLPKTKGTLTNGTLLLLKSLAAFCMLGNVDTLQTPRRGPAAVAASAPVVLLAAEASSSSHMIAPMNTKCFNVAGFQQIDLYPTRSPLAVADFLAWRLAGKEVVEIGSRNGDILSCLQGLGVKRVESIEGDHVYCKKLRARGLAVSCKMLTQANAKDTLPRADAYFGWLPGGNFDGGGGVGHVMHLLMKELSTRPAKASIFLMFDASQSIEMTTLKQMLPRIAPQCNGGLNMSRIFFDESNYPIPSGESFNHEAKDRGVAVQETNYTRPYFGRYGRFGIMHVLQCDVEAGDRIFSSSHSRNRSTTEAEPAAAAAVSVRTHEGRIPHVAVVGAGVRDHH